MEGLFEEEEEEWGSPISHLIAGGIAGTIEHCGMYPVDTIKTHIQAYGGTTQGIKKISVPMSTTFKNLVEKGGIVRLFRGINAIAIGAAPAHAVHFATYEEFKSLFGKMGMNLHISYFIAGVIATSCSDAVFTPMDSIKQKMQLGARQYSGLFDCIVKNYRNNGIFRGFYSGYTTTLAMNIPYSGLNFTSYEFFKKFYLRGSEEHSNVINTAAGASAGIVSASLTNPLDVARTRLQTQTETQSYVKYRSMTQAMSTIWKEEGMRGMTSGIVPRVIFQSTSAAICWLSYEYIKKILKD